MAILRKTKYFDAFRCTGGACPDSCCHEWAVAVDEEAAVRYLQMPGQLGEDLRRYLTQEDGDTILSLLPNGRCPMWREDGLCRLQAEAGEEALCHTCREFPRLRHDYGDFVEQDLELSCPEAAKWILFEDDTLVTKEIPDGEEPDYEDDQMQTLLRSREAVLELLGDKSYSLGEALAALLLYGCRVQAELEGDEEAALEPETELAIAKKVAKPGNMESIFSFFRDLEILKPQWKENLAAPTPGPWLDIHRAAARYFVRRYWLQAVSDEDLLGRVKLIVISMLMLKHLGGDPVEAAQLYSKEIENNADNVDALLDGAYMEPAFADVGLLGLLLEDTL